MITILVAEDHHVVREALCALLARDPEFSVIAELADGRQLLSTVESMHPDILLMDAQMPDHNPIEFVSTVTKRCPSTRVIVLSAYDRQELVVGLLQAGASGYVLKDDLSNSVNEAIHHVANGQEWVSERATAILVESVRRKGRKLEEWLTPREMEVLRAMSLGHNNQQIAKQLVLSEQTVKNYISTIFSKIGVATRVEAVLFAIAYDLVTPSSIRNELDRYE